MIVLSKNKIKEIPDLSKLTKLQKVNLAHNQIKSIPSNLPSLKELRLNENMLTRIDHLPSGIKILDVGKNLFKQLSDVEMIKDALLLQNLNFKGNQLCSLDKYRETVSKLIGQNP